MDALGWLGLRAGNGHPVADGQKFGKPVSLQGDRVERGGGVFTMVANAAVIGDGEYARHPRGVEVEEGKVNGEKGKGVRNQTAVPILGDGLAQAEVRQGEAGEDFQHHVFAQGDGRRLISLVAANHRHYLLQTLLDSRFWVRILFQQVCLKFIININ